MRYRRSCRQYRIAWGEALFAPLRFGVVWSLNRLIRLAAWAETAEAPKLQVLQPDKLVRSVAELKSLLWDNLENV